MADSGNEASEPCPWDPRDWHISIHARPPHLIAADSLAIADRVFPTCRFDSEQVGFPISFEQLFERMDRLAAMHVELDGAFAWSDPHAQQRWRVSGNVYDRNEQVFYLELKGWFPESACNQFLKLLGWPDTAVVFQLLRAGVVVDEPTFRTLAFVW